MSRDLVRRLRPALRADEPDDNAALRSVVISGLAIIVLFCSGIFGWGLFAHLNSAVMADGVIVADSHSKTVQNLEGGILSELLVKNGDRVQAGQVLAYLDSTKADSELGQLVNQYWTARARVTRLQAELDDKRQLVFPDDLMAQASSAVQETITTQTNTFESRWRAYDNQTSVVQKRIEQYREEIAAARAFIAASTEQKSLTEKELGIAKQLYEKGLETLPRVLGLQRSVADLEGKLGERRGDIAKANQIIAGAQAEMAGLRDTRLSDIGKELQEAMTLQTDLGERLNAARDVKKRRAIVSPQDGVVTNVKIFTVGGVLTPGQPIMDIVPSNDTLVVEAKIRPADIDAMREGLPAKVWLSAYKRIEVPPVPGKVITVSADRLEDARTGEPYFSSRIEVDATSLRGLPTVKLQPGMPAEVSVVVAERRAINYFLDPLTVRIDRAFNEH
jgi:HlyD family secretion protein